MSLPEPPRILRIKRKRDQDPLQTLVLEGRKQKKLKRSGPFGIDSSGPPTGVSTPTGGVLFTLARTDEHTDEGSCVLTESTVATSDGLGSRKRKFVIPKRLNEDDDHEILKELTEMLDSFLTVNGSQGGRRKRVRRRSSTSSRPEDIAMSISKMSRDGNFANSTDFVAAGSNEEGEYVYDVYHILLSGFDSNEPLTSANIPQLKIGYIRFFEDDENDLCNLDNDDNDKIQVSDDEDSNAEDYYQNDYPEDEDAGVYSETFELEGEEHDGARPLESYDKFEHEGEEVYGEAPEGQEGQRFSGMGQDHDYGHDYVNDGGYEDEDDGEYDEDDSDDVKIIIPDSSDVMNTRVDVSYEDNEDLYHQLCGDGELDILTYLNEDVEHMSKSSMLDELSKIISELNKRAN